VIRSKQFRKVCLFHTDMAVCGTDRFSLYKAGKSGGNEGSDLLRPFGLPCQYPNYWPAMRDHAMTYIRLNWAFIDYLHLYLLSKLWGQTWIKTTVSGNNRVLNDSNAGMGLEMCSTYTWHNHYFWSNTTDHIYLKIKTSYPTETTDTTDTDELAAKCMAYRFNKLHTHILQYTHQHHDQFVHLNSVNEINITILMQI
jgi:hypothetical protein